MNEQLQQRLRAAAGLPAEQSNPAPRQRTEEEEHLTALAGLPAPTPPSPGIRLLTESQREQRKLAGIAGTRPATSLTHRIFCVTDRYHALVSSLRRAQAAGDRESELRINDELIVLEEEMRGMRG
jgi:hypothetical protein